MESYFCRIVSRSSETMGLLQFDDARLQDAARKLFVNLTLVLETMYGGEEMIWRPSIDGECLSATV